MMPEAQTVEIDNTEVTIVFPGGIAVGVTLAGKSLDISASLGGRPALVRSSIGAYPQITVDIVEARGPDE